jgi:hypothetical protein
MVISTAGMTGRRAAKLHVSKYMWHQRVTAEMCNLSHCRSGNHDPWNSLNSETRAGPSMSRTMRRWRKSFVRVRFCTIASSVRPHFRCWSQMMFGSCCISTFGGRGSVSFGSLPLEEEGQEAERFLFAVLFFMADTSLAKGSGLTAGGRGTPCKPVSVKGLNGLLDE